MKKIILLLLFVMCSACAEVGAGQYGFWFDSRAKEWNQKKEQQKTDLEEQKQKRKRIEEEEKWSLEKQKQQFEQEKIDKQEHKEKEEAKERKQYEEKMIKEQEKAQKQQLIDEQVKKTQEFLRICSEYKEKYCRDSSTPHCIPVKKCRIVSGSKVCWEDKSCTNIVSQKCSGKKPDGC